MVGCILDLLYNGFGICFKWARDYNKTCKPQIALQSLPLYFTYLQEKRKNNTCPTRSLNYKWVLSLHTKQRGTREMQSFPQKKTDLGGSLG